MMPMGGRIGPVIARWAVVLAALFAVACGEEGVRRVSLVRVAPTVDPTCGAPDDARTVTITALGDFPPDLATGDTRNIDDGQVSLDRFPDETRVLAIRVEGPGGELRTVGRTGEFDFSALEDGAELFVFMAPERGFCPVEPMAIGRINPLVARAGDGVVVAGGTDRDGMPIDRVERYDPTAGRFIDLSVDLYAPGLRGASMSALPDGRVVVAGGPRTAYQVYDPTDDSVGPMLLLEGARAHHAAAVLPDGRILLAAGCADVVADGSCDFSTALLDTVLLDVDSSEVVPGPSLVHIRAGGQARVEPDGRVVISGGVDDSGQPVEQAERIVPLAGGPAELPELIDADGVQAGLVSGGTLLAFSHGAMTQQAGVIAPGAAALSSVASAPAPRRAPTLTELEDGSVLVVGGRDQVGAEAALYVPAREAFVDLAAVPGAARSGHAAVRLADGTVLLIGGRGQDGTALADAWIYRHDLTNRFTSEYSSADPEQRFLLSSRDPARVSRQEGPDRYEITGSRAGRLPSEWVVAAGPEFVHSAITARAAATGGGVALFVSFRDAENYRAILLAPNQATRFAELRDGVETLAGCIGAEITSDDLEADPGLPVFEVRLASDSLSVSLDDRPILECSLDDPPPRGRVGVGVIGAAQATVRLDFLRASRLAEL